jgi:DNA polymerase-4
MVADELKEQKLKGKTITLKLRYDNFETITRSRTLTDYIDEREKIAEIAIDLLRRKSQAGTRPVRLLGISLSNFPLPKIEHAWIQMEFPF